MSGFSVEHGRDEDSVARPKVVNLMERGVVLGDDENHVMAAVHGDANEPVVEEGQVGLADNADDDGAVFGDEGEGLLERVATPFGSGSCGNEGGEGPGHAAAEPGAEDADKH